MFKYVILRRLIRRIICPLLLILSTQVFSQYPNLKFENLDTNKGLSSSTCTEIFEDGEGFMWFGTIDGLNRYDGYQFEIYRPILNDTTSISNNRINTIVEDTFGNLWIGTNNGLNIFDKKKEIFYRIPLYDRELEADQGDIINDLFFDSSTNLLWIATKKGIGKLQLGSNSGKIRNRDLIIQHYSNDKNNNNSIDNNNVTKIVKDNAGVIWAISEGDFLNKYNSQKDNFNRVRIDIPNAYLLNHVIKQLLVDEDGNFWIGSNLSFLVVWDRKKDEFKQVFTEASKAPIFDIYQDKKGIVWIATDGDGLYLFNKSLKVQQHISYSPFNDYSLSNNQPSKILEDKEGNFWFGSYNKGITKLVLSKSAFGHYFYEYGNPKGLSSKISQSVLQDSNGRIWIGVDGGGLNLFNESEETFKHYRANSNNSKSLSSDKILYLTESFDKSIWVCTWDGGLNKFNPETETFIQYIYDPQNPYSIGQNTVWCAIEDDRHRLWVGTQTEGLNLFDPLTKRFTKFKNESGVATSLASDLVFSIFIDSKNRLLIGTSQGLSIVELDTLQDYIPSAINFTKISVKPIQDNRINFITEDHKGNIWLGTDIGMYQLDGQLKLIKSYTTNQGLPNNLVLGIQEDDDFNLWITTKSGLSKYQVEEDKFYNFNTQDGVQGIEFQSKSIDKTNTGEIIAGGINGFNIFNPKNIVIKPKPLKPIITKFKMFNEVVKVGQKINNKVILNNSISNTDLLELKYNQGFLSFEFVAFNYKNQKHVSYQYRMLGLHEDFIKVGEDRSANYSSIPPGDYVFQVKASLDNNWNNVEVTSINIHISPPLWRTWWAYALYLIVFIMLFYVGLHFYTKIINEEKERELDQMKLKFFINVSHELRTPLTLILNPVDKIISAFNKPDIVKSNAYTLQRSARRLYYLVNQLLDFRKMDLNKVPLKLVEGDFVKFNKDVFELFKDLAKTKGVKYKFKSTFDELPMNFDPDKVEKIVTNLLSNAIKFTKKGGSIKLKISKPTIKSIELLSKFSGKNKFEDFIQIKIEDTGIGFKDDQFKDVFGRFVNAGNTKTGMGIGLNITKGLVALHKGEIFVKSTFEKGTVFTVLLPVNLKNETTVLRGDEKHNLNEFDLNSVKSVEYELGIFDENIGEKENLESNSNLNPDGKKKQVILVVEDNKELRKHLVYEFSNSFKIIEAVNGVDGLEKIKKHHPDLVISDVMMPKMDGFELCRLVKTEIEICHIPIILLTARSLEEDQIEGYNTGADEYLSKPFNISILKARVNNLLEAKKRLRDKFASIGGVVSSSEITSNSLDEAFLDKATKAIMDNISDPDYKLDNLLNEIGIGRSQFYRKINSITGQNPSSFIRTIRLKYASELLFKNEYSIKEITHMSGFNSTAYFSKTFRELFGLTPTEYLEQKLGNSQK